MDNNAVKVIDGVRYELSLFDQCYCVTGFSEDYFSMPRKVELLEQIDDMPVVEIGDEAFKFCENLTSIKISKRITTIDNSAFELCSNLTEVIIPNNVVFLGAMAFYHCSSLATVVIGDGIKCIFHNTFSQCRNLKNVILGDRVQEIDFGAFAGCVNLENITMPEAITYIGDNAFYHCDKLKKEHQYYYKAFAPGFKYLENKWYDIDEDENADKSDFYACKNAFDLFNHCHGEIGHNLIIYVVELGGVSKEIFEDSKTVAKRIKLVYQVRDYASLLN